MNITIEDVVTVSFAGYPRGNGFPVPPLMTAWKNARGDRNPEFARFVLQEQTKSRSRIWLGHGNKARRRMVALMGLPQPVGSPFGGGGEMHDHHIGGVLRAAARK